MMEAIGLGRLALVSYLFVTWFSISVHASDLFKVQANRTDEIVQFKEGKFSLSERPFASGSAGSVYALSPKGQSRTEPEYVLKIYRHEGKQHYEEYLNFKVLAQDQVPQCQTIFGNGFLVKERVKGQTLEKIMEQGLSAEQKEALVTFMNNGMKRGVFGKDWNNPENLIWDSNKKSWVLIDPEYNLNLARDFFSGKFKGYHFSRLIHETYSSLIQSLERKATKLGHPLNLSSEIVTLEELEAHHIANKTQIQASKTLQTYENALKEIERLPVRYPETERSLISRLGDMISAFNRKIFGNSQSSISNRTSKPDFATEASGSSKESNTLNSSGAK